MRKLTLMCVFVLFLTACAKTNAQEIPQKEKEVVIVDTTKKETQTLGDATTKKETVVADKKAEGKKIAEAKEKEEVKQKEENKKTQPVQPQPKKEVKLEQKPATPAVAPKPQPKPQPKPTPAPEKPKPKVERKRIGNLGNSGLEFKTYDELLAYIGKTFEDYDGGGRDKLEAKVGYAIKGWSGWTVDYSDGSQTWTIQWKKR